MVEHYVGSEVGKLRKIILHRPELSLSRLTPTNCKGFLFDEVMYVDQACVEHDRFSETLRSHGIEILLISNLLKETLNNPIAREWILEKQVSEYRYGHTTATELRDHYSALSADGLASYLIGGFPLDEFRSVSASPVIDIMDKKEFLMDPLPNMLFTRDSSCWIYSGVSIGFMSDHARRWESNLIRAIYKFHPQFQVENSRIYCGNEDPDLGHTTLEGGDILVLGGGIVLIGLSQRTSPQGAELLTRKLFKLNDVHQVIVVNLPKLRSCMHLDTVLTQVDRDCFTIYKDVINDDMLTWEFVPGYDSEHVKINPIKDGPKNAIERALRSAQQINSIRWVPTGGDAFQAEREQWNDANNVLALEPGTVIAYENNAETIGNLENAGITVEKIPHHNLGLGRGGPRCLSCPVLRDDVN